MSITVSNDASAIVLTIQEESAGTIVVSPGIGRGPRGAEGPQGPTPDISVYNVDTDVSVSNGTLTLDAEGATTFFVTLDQNITSIQVNNWPDAGKTQRIAIYLKQDSVGGRVVTNWPSQTRWSYGVAPLLSTAPNAVDCVLFDTFDSGNTIYAGVVGQDYKSINT